MTSRFVLWGALLVAGCGQVSRGEETDGEGAGVSGSGGGGSTAAVGHATMGTGATGSDSAAGGESSTGGLMYYYYDASLPRVTVFCDQGSFNGVDADGDGYGAPVRPPFFPITSAECILLGTIEEYLPDCDDNDAEVCFTGFADVDGDGFGDPEQPSCFAGDETPPALSRDFSDCDDSDARIYSDAPDVPNDERDDNCDGTDGTSADAIAGSELHAPNASSIPDTNACVETAGLSVVDFFWSELLCEQWDERDLFAYLAIRNSGATSSPAATLVVVSDRSEDWTLQLSIPALEPEEITPHYALGKIHPEITLSFEAASEQGCAAATVTQSAIQYCELIDR